MEFGIFNLMGSREASKPTAQVFGEVAEQTKVADARTVFEPLTKHADAAVKCAALVGMAHVSLAQDELSRLAAKSQVQLVTSDQQKSVYHLSERTFSDPAANGVRFKK